MRAKLLKRIHRAAQEFWLTTIASILLLVPIACQASASEASRTFREEVWLSGSCGSALNQLAIYKSEIGTFEGPTTFCVWSDGTVWIADSYNHRMKRFSRSGEVIQSISLDSAGAIDDMSCDCQGRILYRDWLNREFLTMIDTAGNVLTKFPLPTGKASGGTTSLVTLGETNIYAIYMDSTAEDIGLRYDLNGKLIEVRKRDLRLWAETGGRFYVKDSSTEKGDAWGSFDPKRIRRPDGSLFLTDSVAYSPWAHAIGLDSIGNLYLSFWKNIGGEVAAESYVSVYTPLGKKLAIFPVRRFNDIIADSHFPKVSQNGDVYILTVSDDLARWTLYRYTAK